MKLYITLLCICASCLAGPVRAGAPSSLLLTREVSSASAATAAAAIVASPERYDGISIITSGVLSTAQEDVALYVDKEHYEHLAQEGAIWLEISPIEVEKYKRLDGKYVYVAGVITNRRSGYNGLYPVKITRVSGLWDSYSREKYRTLMVIEKAKYAIQWIPMFLLLATILILPAIYFRRRLRK